MHASTMTFVTQSFEALPLFISVGTLIQYILHIYVTFKQKYVHTYKFGKCSMQILKLYTQSDAPLFHTKTPFKRNSARWRCAGYMQIEFEAAGISGKHIHCAYIYSYIYICIVYTIYIYVIYTFACEL